MILKNRKTNAMKIYFKLIKDYGLWNSRSNLLNYLNFLFRDTSLNGKNVLDVGGGSGLISFYASIMGAKCVTCLEPEIAGSTSGIISHFKKIKSELGINNVCLKPSTLQDFNSEKGVFDIILLHNSINHLDENSCIALDYDFEARKSYTVLCDKLFQLGKPGAKVIIVDCSRTNLFSFLQLKNPFSPDIEWEKHQKPQIWVRLLKSSGFIYPTIRWMSLLGFNRPQMFFNNKFISLITTSHFLIIVEKPMLF